MASRKEKSYFREKTQIINADGTKVPGTRFRDKDSPTEQTFKELFDSITFILNKEDTASESYQGLVKTASGSNAKNNTPPNDGFTYAAQIKNLPTVKDKTQTIKSLTAKLVTAVANPSSLDNNDYTVELSTEFISFLSTELDTLQANINSVSAGVPDMSSIQSDITAIQGNIVSLQGSLATNTANIATNTASLATNTTNIATKTSNIATTTAAIAAVNPADNRFLGEIVTLSTGVPPSANWIICDGGAISRTTYAALFTLIGTSYGAGDGSTTFNLPDLGGKVQRGYKSGDPSYGAIGQTGGAENVTLTANQLPAHTHDVDITVNATLETYSADGTSVATARSGDSSGTSIDSTIQVPVLGATNVNLTAGSSIDTRDSYLMLYYYIKVSA